MTALAALLVAVSLSVPGVEPGTCGVVETDQGMRVWCDDSEMVRVVEEPVEVEPVAAPAPQPIAAREVAQPTIVVRGNPSAGVYLR